MVGKLIEVFEISGRGCVVLVDIESGACRVGDALNIGDRAWTISGIEMLNYNAEGRRRIAEGWKPPSGILLRDARKTDVLPHLGSVISGILREDREQ